MFARTGQEFAFPQSNGDVFAFTEPVNSAFQHAVPRSVAGPRISVILWGRLERSGLLSHSIYLRTRGKTYEILFRNEENGSGNVLKAF